MSELKKDEYIILCSGYGMMNRYPAEMYHVNGEQRWKAKDEIRGEYITNYGSIINLHKHYREPSIYIYHKGENMLTQEFILYYNEYIQVSNLSISRDSSYNINEIHNKILTIISNYNQYNPKASENYRIEKQKSEIEKMTLDLQQRETGIVQDEKILYEKQIEFIKEKEKFTEEKKIHKQKSKNLLRRENSVFLKESIKSVHQELKDISYSLSDSIDLLDDIEPSIEQRLNQTIQKLNTMFSEEIVVEAVEVH